MAEKIIKNPSLLPSDLAFELSGNTITAISGHPIAGSGGGTVSDLVYYPVFDNSNGNVTFHLGPSAHGPEPGGAWHISGADGVDGISPKVQINPQTNEWEVSEDGGTTWASTYVKATGPAGQNGTNGTNGTDGKDGKDGTNGKDGVSPTVSTSVIPSGNRVTFTYGEGSSTYIDVMSGTPGTPGTPGTDGFSPTVTTSEISPTTQHPQGGTSVTITDSVGVHQFDVWNGLNGEGATVNLLEGTGIQITENGTDYTIGVSADYALKSELPDVTDMATKTWVDRQGFITKNADDLTYYYKKTETSSTSEISNALTEKVNLPTSQQSGQLVYNATTNVWEAASTPSIPDITANNGLSANGHTVGISTNNIDVNKQYAWTTTGWQLVSVPSIPDITAHNGLSANGHTIGIDDTNIVANTQYAWTTSGWKQVSIPDSYATKLYVNDASANAYSEAVAKIPTDYITKDVDNLTYYYKKTETSSTSQLSTEFANKINKPDTSLTDKYLVLRTDTNGAVSGWCNFNDKIYSKSESDGRYMQKITDSTLSGDGTSNNPLGIDSDNFYELDTAGNYLASQTSNQKTIISTTPALDNAISRVSTSADVWDTVSAKSTVTINTTNNEIKVNNNANSAISAVSYDICEVGEPDLIPQKMIVGTSSGAFVSYVTGGKCNGMGTLFFWLESQQPWNPVNE